MMVARYGHPRGVCRHGLHMWCQYRLLEMWRWCWGQSHCLDVRWGRRRWLVMLSGVHCKKLGNCFLMRLYLQAGVLTCFVITTTTTVLVTCIP